MQWMWREVMRSCLPSICPVFIYLSGGALQNAGAVEAAYGTLSAFDLLCASNLVKGSCRVQGKFWKLMGSSLRSISRVCASSPVMGAAGCRRGRGN